MKRACSSKNFFFGLATPVRLNLLVIHRVSHGKFDIGEMAEWSNALVC